MTDRFIIKMLAAFLAVLAIVVVAAAAITRLGEMSSTPAPAAVVPSVQVVALTPADSSAEMQNLFRKPLAQVRPAPVPTAPSMGTVTMLQPTDRVVSSSDIDQLVAAVKLGQTAGGDVGKDVWAKETPVAEQLLQGQCDCDQRNWLKHFVKTGNDAISGSEDYFQSVQLLAQLRRGNDESAVIQSSH